MIGIYKITNPKGKVYIGQSINIVGRMKSYSKMYCKQQPKIYNSLKKYGWENHEFDVLVECKIKELNFLETLYKKFYLNKLKGWEFTLFLELYDLGGGPKSEKTKKKIGDANRGNVYSDEAKIKISKALKGRVYSKETIKKMSKPRSEEAKINMRGKIRTKSHCENISKGKVGKKQPSTFTGRLVISNQKHYLKGSERNSKISKSLQTSIIQYNKDGEFIKRWDSISEACLFLGKSLTDGNIGLVCKGVRKTAHGFIWRYCKATF